MAENDKRKFELPWTTLLPVLAALAGIVAQYKPLVSTRPPVPSEKPMPVTAEQDVDARLWQDPIAVAQKQEALLEAEIKANRIPKEDHSARHDIDTLANLLSDRARTFEGHVLLLAVMLDAGPYSEQGESRLRARHAVLEGLSESGFMPKDGEHIGFVTTNWPPPALENAAPSPSVPSAAIERALLLPWEECEARPDAKVFPEHTMRVIVVWLPAVNFNPNPLRRFAALVERLAPENIRDRVDVRLIGPANSTGLQNMVREVKWLELSQTTQKTLDGVRIVSPRATAPDFAVLSAANVPPSVSKFVPTYLETAVKPWSRNGLKFFQTIATDDYVLHALVAELERRRVPIVPQTRPDGRPVAKLAHVVVLTEWDTPYGRSLSKTFAAEASAQNAGDSAEPPDKPPAWIHFYNYLRGIDGQLPGDSGKDNQREQGQKTQSSQDAVAIEATEGLNQSDYLRRLARQMKEDNARWQREDGWGIRAIGLLGSDIYDKLMILRALRPQFPDAVFFTNNYDAHFERRDDWDDTHNLVIASPFGSTVPEIYLQQHIAPFRDSNQASMYIGTLVATDRMTKDEAECLSWQPRIFEISRRGAYDLSPPWYITRPGESKIVFESNHAKPGKTRTWFQDWLFARGVIPQLVVILLTVLAMAAWISVNI